MGKPPRVSVIIPAYNEERYIGSCLGALKQQTREISEIIVVDNNCTDKTADIARKLGARVVKETIQGMTPARERGFRETKGEIIVRTDADTVVPRTWIERITAPFSDPAIVAVSGGLTSPNRRRYPEIIFVFHNWVYPVLTRLFTGHDPLIGPNMAVRKSAWEKVTVHTDDRLVHEDMDLACHMAEQGKVVFISSCVVPYSLRRVKKAPVATAMDYPPRYFETIFLHHPFLGLGPRKNF